MNQMQHAGRMRRPAAIPRSSTRARSLLHRPAARPPSIVCSASSSDWPARIANVVREQPALLLAASMVAMCQRLISTTRNTIERVFPKLSDVDSTALKQQLLSLGANMRLMALFVLPLARVAPESLTAVYARTFEKAAFGFAKMYLFCLFMRVLLSWFPGIDWNTQPWTFLRLITEPYLQIYRGILPPLFGQLDFTPLFGFLILQDVVEVMSPTYTMGLHAVDTSTRWTTSDVMCYFDGF